MLLIQTELANEGREAVEVEHVTPIEWEIAKLAEDEGYTSLTHRDDAWYGSTYWTGPDWTRVGGTWQHPGKDTSTVRTFLVPEDGRVTVSGRVRKADVAPRTDGVRAAIRHGVETLWEAEIDGGDASGVEHDVTLRVSKGDAIRFVVGKRKAITCDTTHWDPVIAYEDGRTFRASEGFSTVQGQGGWFYQMEDQECPATAVPRMFALDLHGALRESPLNVGEKVVWESGEFLPFFVLAATDNQNGLLVSLLDPGPWSVSVTRDVEGLRIRVQAGDPASLSPGESVELPRLAVAGYAGQWLEGMMCMEGLLHGTKTDGFEELRDQVSAALRRGQRILDDDLLESGGSESAPPTEFGLWVMLQAEYRQEDDLSPDSKDAFAEATRRHLQGTAMLLDDLRSTHGMTFLKREARQLERITESIEVEGMSLDQWRAHYQRTRSLKRHVALANPLLDEFQELLFVKRVPTSYSHLVMQYYGWRARAGGGLFVLERPGFSLACRDILDGCLSDGNVLEPRLSYDGQQIVFSFVDGAEAEYDPASIGNDDPSDAGYYHIYSVGIDGSDLTQLTDGPFDDLMPAWLPDGGVVFSSTRRRGYARCFGAQFSPRWDVYTLHRMQADGSRLRTLSFHDTNEWFPAVSHTGHILYSRWDYIDRDAVTHQNLWSTRPDGTNPVAVWGNATSSPHCTFQIRPIPDSTKLVFTASAHHSITAGSLALVDPSINNNGQSAIERITPEIAFPEAETRDIREYYAA
ncbi:MAG: TolB family protein, partial [Planctomycetota bacterium]